MEGNRTIFEHFCETDVKHAEVNYIIHSQREPHNTDPLLTLMNREKFLMVNF